MATLWVSKNGSNSNSGSSSKPLETIQAAVNLASEGTNIKVKAGTYKENVSIKKDGISLVSADGQYAAKIQAASQTKATIMGFGTEDIKISGFDITGPSQGSGIHFGMSGTNFTNLVKNLTIEDNRVNGSGKDGIKISQADNVKILDNKITDSGEQGIDFVAVNGSKIAGNIIEGADGPSALMVKGGSSNVTIDNNKVHDVKNVGISVGGWSDEHWMRPGTRHYEAKDLDVTGNMVWNTGKSAILVSGAHNSHITGNFLDSNPGYDAVIWLDSSAGGHANPIYNKNITLQDNTFLRSDWLQVNPGNSQGLRTSGNDIDKGKVMSAQKGVFGSSDNAQEVSHMAAASEAVTGTVSIDKIATSDHSTNQMKVAQAHALDGKTIAADTVSKVIAINKDDVSAGDDSGLLSEMLFANSDEGVLVYKLMQETGSELETGSEAADNTLLFYSLSNEVASGDISSALTKWQSLEDAVPLNATSSMDTTHYQDQDNHQTVMKTDWLLS